MKLSQKKIEKIQEQILSFLYHIYPESVFTSNIAEEIARDEEFVYKLLKDLSAKKIIISIKKNPKGIFYSRRKKWRLTSEANQKYKEML
jgi:predicted transcriptional regulator with HTH domain